MTILCYNLGTYAYMDKNVSYMDKNVRESMGLRDELTWAIQHEKGKSETVALYIVIIASCIYHI